VVVVGAGNSAGQAVLSLAGAGARVASAVRGGSLADRMSAYLVERVERHPLVDVRLRAQVTALHEDGGLLAAVTLTDAAATGPDLLAGGRRPDGRGSSATRSRSRRAPPALRGG